MAEPTILGVANPTLVTAIATAFGASFGAMVAGVFGIWNASRERIAADKRHRRELAIKAAVEEYAQNRELALRLSERTKGVVLLPIDTNIVSMVTLVEALADEDRIDENSIARVLDKMHRATKVAIEKTEAYSGDLKADRKKEG